MSKATLSISAHALGKRHGRAWIWRGMSCSVAGGGTLALLGANGSGKSSLLRILCGFDGASEGELSWSMGDEGLSRELLPGHISYCAPDQSLIHDFTVEEHLAFHRTCRLPSEDLTLQDMVSIAMLEGNEHRRVGQLSSGMRQRLALTLAFATPSAALFLDEPTSHLDAKGRDWYRSLIADHRHDRTLVVASNHDAEEVPSGAKSVVLGLNA
ncbi:MAG: ABC transporter ATP-binding protein [Crocinitomicaceae bacterium TMED114]|nr:MAG: ABC transporter ATP-binding protein [Crocinitomicaceae bacterium TMED114]